MLIYTLILEFSEETKLAEYNWRYKYGISKELPTIYHKK